MWLDVRLVSLLVVTFLAVPSLHLRRQRREDVNNDCKTPRDVPGHCINIKSCPALIEILRKRGEQREWRDYLLESRCGDSEGNVVKVCCPAGDILQDASVCGLGNGPSNRLGIGKSLPGGWPWMAALGYTSPTKPLEWLCAGSLISNRHVLTSAHCLRDTVNRNLSVVRFGDLNLDDSVADSVNPVEVAVEQLVVHEKYDPTFNTHDIAVITLKERVNFTSHIRPVCIPTPSTFPEDITDYEPYLIGWRSIGQDSPTETALQEATARTLEQDFCKNAYRSTKGVTIDDKVICALYNPGESTCHGNLGGPLILPKRVSKSFYYAAYYLIGVVSYGFKCTESKNPAVHTNVAFYADWIKKVVHSQ